ncbi:MAG: FKBP-type peptidyl-prolyl cis-trans isomerase [Myxococcota bacterium]
MTPAPLDPSDLAPAEARVEPDQPHAVALAALADGIRAGDVAVGHGAEDVGLGSVVVIDYIGWTDGVVWDASYRRPAPERFRVGDDRTPAAWSTGLVGMRAGGVRQLEVSPPDDADPTTPPAAPMVVELAVRAVYTPPLPMWRAAYHPVAGGIEAVDLVIGDGPALTPGMGISVDYVGWLPDGTEFDTTWRWPEPFRWTWGEGQVQWEQALAGMAVGGRRQLRIPAAAAFGPEGRPAVIPPDADLILTVDVHPR